MKRIKRLSVAVMMVCAVLSASAATNTLKRIEPPTEPCKAAMIVAEGLPRLHLNHAAFDANIATNALSLFLNTLDFDHTYFLASDIAEFQQHGAQLAQELRAGDVRLGVGVFNRFMERVANRTAYVTQLLDQGFDTSRQESYAWKRKDAPWATNETAWNELWRGKIKNEYVGRVVATKLTDEEQAQEKAKKAKGLLIWLKKNPKKVASDDDTDLADSGLNPREFILKRYKQFLSMLQDSDLEWVLQRYLAAFTMAYDPHSEYLSPSTEEDFDISMRLSLVGIGALLRPEDGAAKIERLTPGGPAERDGRLKAGDKIIAVAQGDSPAQDVLHWPLSKTVRLIRGKKGTKVVLTVVPKNDLSMTKTRKIDLVRDEIKLEDQSAKEEMRVAPSSNGAKLHLAVVTIPEFYADMKAQQQGKRDATSVARDVRNILATFSTQRVDGVVLDLRNNGGGSLEEAVELTGEFIGSGPVVQVRQQNDVQVLVDSDPDVDYAGPLVVLVNRLSASASEILTAALQDYGRAVVVGDSKTHGKGTVQSLLPMGDLSEKLGALKLTTASFYRIAGGSTQLKGVTPDIVVSSMLDALETGEEFLPNALQWSSVDSAGYARDRTLQPLLPALRKLSEQRLAKDPAFATHRKLLQVATEHANAKAISLNLKERLSEAKEDREIERLQESEDEEVTVGKEKRKKNDVVLDETLRILTDLVNLEQTQHIAQSTR